MVEIGKIPSESGKLAGMETVFDLEKYYIKKQVTALLNYADISEIHCRIDILTGDVTGRLAELK
jgi:hypothetical protein